MIKKATGIQNLLVIKRKFSHSNPIEKLDGEKVGDKKLIELRFFNNITIYVEEKD